MSVSHQENSCILCEPQWPSFEIGWLPEGSILNSWVVKAVWNVLARSSGHPDQFPCAGHWLTLVLHPPPSLEVRVLVRTFGETKSTTRSSFSNRGDGKSPLVMSRLLGEAWETRREARRQSPLHLTLFLPTLKEQFHIGEASHAHGMGRRLPKPRSWFMSPYLPVTSIIERPQTMSP